MGFINSSSDLGRKIINAYYLQFIGDEIFDESELDSIKKYLFERYKEIGNGVKSDVFFKQCLMVVLVNNAKKWGDSGDDRYFAQQNFKDIFDDETLTWNDFDIVTFYGRDRKWLLDNKGRTHRYKQTILYNAFSPRRSIAAFVELVFNVLTDPTNVKSGFFDNSYEEYADDYLRFVDKINTHFLDSQVSDSEEIVNLYNNTYKLTAALRHGFQYDQVNVAKLVSRTVSYIKSYISKENILDGTYYSALVKEFLSQVRIRVSDTTTAVIKAEKVRSIKDWYAYYSWSYGVNPKVVIKMPILKLQSRDQYNDLKLFVYLNERHIYSKNIEIYGEDYNPHLRTIEIDISNQLKTEQKSYNFRISIFDGDKVIFDTKEKLFRSFIVFSSSSEKEVNDVFLKVKNEYIAIFPKNSAVVFSNEDTVDDANFFTSFGTNAFELRPKEGDYIEFPNKRVIFSESDKDPSLNVEFNEIPYLKFETPQESLLPIYSDVNSIILTPSIKTIAASLITVEIVRVNIDSGEKVADKIFFDVAGEKNKTIKLIASKHEIFNESGYFLLAFFANDKKVAQLECLIGNYELRFDDKYPNKNGIHQGHFYENGVEVLNEAFDQCNKVFCVEKVFGRIICSIPYLEYKLVGRPASSFTHLLSNKKEIFYVDEILDLSNVILEIETSYRGSLFLMVDDKKVELTGSMFNLSSLISKQVINSSITLTFYINSRPYEFMNIYTREVILDDGASLFFDSETEEFYYDLEGFIGDSCPMFQITIYDEDGNIFESPILYGTSGNFQITEFIDGFYYFKVKRIDDEGKMSGAFLYKYDTDYLEFGDCNRVAFKNSCFMLTKCKNNKKQSVSFKGYRIDSFEFIGYQTFPVFKVTLYHNKHVLSENIYAVLKSNTVVLYSEFKNEELSGSIFFNSETSQMSLEAKPGYEQAKSFYFVEE